ncbi:MAG: imidazole glycerol phosphate synthase subunit HisH [Steroidobacteraceae bacterium]
MSRRDVVIVDTGGANIASLRYALGRLDESVSVSTDFRRIAAASHVILPGVGAAADAMQRLRAHALHERLPTLRQPVLGICLGMQLLFESSAEGPTACLGIIPGRARRLDGATGLRVPHMGWNTLEPGRASPLAKGLQPTDYAYFVHSYALPVSGATVATTSHGCAFSAMVEQANFFGTQFHPERSAAVGAQVLQNFLAIG